MIIIVILILPLVIILIGGEISTFNTESKAKRIVDKVEEFKKTNKRLPDTLADLGIQETKIGSIYYEKLSKDHYIVWYGTVLGESTTYDSYIQKWE